MGVLQKSTSTLGDLNSPTIDAQYIERRWQDWSKRVRALYADARNWLGTDFAFKEQPTQKFHEELMKSTGVPPKQLTALDISDKSGAVIGRLTPVALWVIGANGRIDAQSPHGNFIIVDAAENFKAPQWEVVPVGNHRKVEPLTKQAFRRLFI